MSGASASFNLDILSKDANPLNSLNFNIGLKNCFLILILIYVCLNILTIIFVKINSKKGMVN